MQDVRQLQEAAEAAARAGGKVLRELFHSPRNIKLKGHRDLVTDADHAAQEAITRLLRRAFPEHGFLTEEDDPDLPTAGDVVWVIDPLDGTSNYSRRQPNFAVSVAAQTRGGGGDGPEGLAGVVYDPVRDELFSAGRGQGSTLNGRPIRASELSDFGEAIIGFDLSHLRARRLRMLGLVTLFADDVHTLRAIGSAAMALAWVAAGRLDAYLNMSLGPWDVAAGELLIAEAGGMVTGLEGGRWSPAASGCVASNGRLHPALLALGTQTVAAAG